MEITKTSGRVFGLFFGAALILGLSADVEAQRRAPQKRVVQGDTLYTLMAPGGIPAIFDPKFISVKEASKTAFVEDTTHPEGGQTYPLYHDLEPLIVVVGETEVKAYSAWHLDGHEVVNDYIDGVAIAVTW